MTPGKTLAKIGKKVNWSVGPIGRAGMGAMISMVISIPVLFWLDKLSIWGFLLFPVNPVLVPIIAGIFAALCALVIWIQNIGLDVPPAEKKLDEWGERFDERLKELARKVQAAAVRAKNGIIFWWKSPLGDKFILIVGLFKFKKNKTKQTKTDNTPPVTKVFIGSLKSTNTVVGPGGHAGMSLMGATFFYTITLIWLGVNPLLIPVIVLIAAATTLAIEWLQNLALHVSAANKQLDEWKITLGQKERHLSYRIRLFLGFTNT